MIVQITKDMLRFALDHYPRLVEGVQYSTQYDLTKSRPQIAYEGLLGEAVLACTYMDRCSR